MAASSLASLLTQWKAQAVVVSTPEFDLEQNNVMSILEALPDKLNMPEGSHFSLTADFASSASGDYCKRTVRWIDKGGAACKIGDNMEHLKTTLEDLTAAQLEDLLSATNSQTSTCDAIAIEHSFWCKYWSGLVAGSLLQAAITGRDVPTLKESNYKKGLFLRTNVHPNARVVVVVSVDGGPVTQVEKVLIPSTVFRVICNINRRSYTWGKHLSMVWCHFPTVGDLIASLAGEENLEEDFNPRHFKKYFVLEGGHSAVFTVSKGIRDPSTVGEGGLLTCSVADALKGCPSICSSSVTRACQAVDLDTLKFLIGSKADVNVPDSGTGNRPLHHIITRNGEERDPDCVVMAKYLIDQRADINAVGGSLVWTPLICACYWGSVGIAKTLLEAKADTSLLNKRGQTALASVKAGQGTEQQKAELLAMFEKMV